MIVNLEQLRSIMKESGLNVYRDEAPITQAYPYIIYEFVNEQHKRASNKVWSNMPLYQISLITDGVETDLKPLKDAFNKYGVNYEQFTCIPFDENDEKVIQFITNVRCIDE